VEPPFERIDVDATTQEKLLARIRYHERKVEEEKRAKQKNR
jgi:hypothetical protein